MAWNHKDLLTIDQLSADDIHLVLDTAEPLKQIFDRSVKKFPTLRGKVVVNLFYEASTRTRTSFEMAGKWLSADVVNISASASSVTKGESLADTGRTIESLGADLVVMRHPSSGAAHFLAAKLKAGVINAGDGRHSHPSQALLDLFTLKEKVGRIEGLTVTIIGDIVHSRVARSNIIALNKMGANVRLVGPRTLMPTGIESMGAQVYDDLDLAIDGADVLMALRIQNERQSSGLFPSTREYQSLFGLDHDRIQRLDKDVIIMHPGPANLGVEITQALSTDEKSVIRDQVQNGVAIRMALLYLMTGGDVRDVENAH